jgi:hypothetical protein
MISITLFSTYIFPLSDLPIFCPLMELNHAFYTPGINLDTIGSLQRQTAGELSTPYQIWSHHSSLKRRGLQLKKN